jgi:probable rRNA maturation factor
MDLHVDSGSTPLTEELVERLAAATAEVAGIQLNEVGVKVVGDKEIARLNREYRGEDGPTDVLSFPREDNQGGDIVISGDAARRQAEAAGWSEEDEYALLLTHGLLHLLGRDHGTADERSQMDGETANILSRLGIESRAYL